MHAHWPSGISLAKASNWLPTHQGSLGVMISRDQIDGLGPRAAGYPMAIVSVWLPHRRGGPVTARPGLHGGRVDRPVVSTSEGSMVKSAVPLTGTALSRVASTSFDWMGPLVVGTSLGLMASHHPSPSRSTTSGWLVSGST